MSDDAALGERARTDASAFGELCRRYAPLVYRFIYSRLRDQTTAEDLTSDVFHRVLRAVDRYQPPTPFGSLLYLQLLEVLAAEPDVSVAPESVGAEAAGAEIDPTFLRRLGAGLVAERARFAEARRRRWRRRLLDWRPARPRLP